MTAFKPERSLVYISNEKNKTQVLVRMCRKEKFYAHVVGTEISTTPMEIIQGLPCSSNGKESACNTGDMGSNPVSGSFPGEGNGYSL